MTTLTTSPLAPLLTRLFAEADAAQPQLDQLGPDTERLMRSKTDYATLYGRLKDYALAVSPETGALLYVLARGCRARTIIEFGTSFGISTLHLAAALRDNGGGRLITTEFEHAKLVRAEANLEAGDLVDLVEFREGDALQTLSKDLPDRIDLVLLDGAKALYADVLDRLESRLSPGALIVADNADHCPDYLARVRDPAQGYLSVTFAGDVELSMRFG